MKVLTLNCHSWQEENQLEKIKYLAKTIQEENYDVIALQEVSQSIKAQSVYGNKKKDNFGLILLAELKQLGLENYSMVWDFAHIGYDIYEEGSAIITKHPIIKRGSFFVSESKDTTYWKTRKIVYATIFYQGKNITFYSCHLGWWNDEEEPFREQVNRFMEHIDDHELSFLMGDFNNNAHLRGEGYDYMIQNNFYDTYALAMEKDEGTTVQGKIAGWDENKQNLRIDLVLSNKPVKVFSSKVIFNGMNRKIISDHFGVEVQLNV
ncbi:endonuclease/exonuclease/phosphatase family protein [Bacillus cytotoxicus]|uniref:Endonuclease/exonuclease/phosphatase n=1 Tax=Bacillus cytotoxicus (strain DSM 22905 / CIP 110041 / 391-98 / NVH 391-98) TaxID=315749 RepID=A7GKQ6_BACCN|nr:MULTISPECIES: endonuclease/exonuclease/phosphatase family protein [Bacillus cereus group]ABS20714.1 Endonuclease/exonuclease/phosphatase [Bacillus cytotoxicus NVH 391-98]AWC27348.1 endonuclease [Bacillus cytotoxicus]AWC31382.1 endonuclease [Bacillus cytotoxicus]AWC35421.1 endonuclease [Bacillus cytotoxicus]AWC41278.1 endonuclease [Bacillus cytotoxicus]